MPVVAFQVLEGVLRVPDPQEEICQERKEKAKRERKGTNLLRLQLTTNTSARRLWNVPDEHLLMEEMVPV